MKIGIGVTTSTDWNKYKLDFFKGYDIIVFNSDQTTIAKDKNKLIKQLYDTGCDYLFIFDDDTFPIKEGWEQFFIDAAEKNEVDHFILGNEAHLGKGTKLCDDLTSFDIGTGCMMFLTRRCIEKVGYLNTKYGKYGYEHAAYSWRICKAGLTPSWYVSVDGWEEYIYSWDLQKEDAAKRGFVKEEWSTPTEKAAYIAENESVFNAELASAQVYYPYEQSTFTKKQKPGKRKVAFFAPDKTDNTSFWRCHGVLPYLECNEFELVDISFLLTQEGETSWVTFLMVDVLIFQRPCLDWHIDAILLAQSMGVKVISDYDDNLLCVDRFNPTWEFYDRMKKVIMRCIHICDEVWVSTEPIKKHYQKFNKNIVVIPNSWNDYLFPVEQKKAFNPNTKNVLWRGGKTHYSDIDDVKEILVKVIEGNKDWTFHFWGELLMFLHIAKRTGENFIQSGNMSTKQYFDALIELNPNIVIFPLSKTDFNNCKSNIAWLEATYAGAAFYGASNLSEFKITGMGCFMDIYVLHALKPNIMKEMNEVSWEYICQNLLLSNINETRRKQILNYL